MVSTSGDRQTSHVGGAFQVGRFPESPEKAEKVEEVAQSDSGREVVTVVVIEEDGNAGVEEDGDTVAEEDGSAVVDQPEPQTNQEAAPETDAEQPLAKYIHDVLVLYPEPDTPGSEEPESYEILSDSPR